MLTPTEHRVLNVVRDYVIRHHQGPTVAEIGAAIGVQSRGTVYRYVRALADKGYLLRGRRWRGIRLVESPATEALPLLGRIAAGRPIEAIADQAHLDLNALFVGPQRFVLQVTGDSMIEAGILDGDYVIIERRATVHDGEIAVVLVDNDEVTLKRVKQHPDGQIELIPANRTLTSLRFPAERIQFQGVLVGQLRTYG